MAANQIIATQAKDDLFRWTEDELKFFGLLSTVDGRTVVTLDVMGNDLGGKAKTLFSVDDGLGNGGQTFLQQLLERDVTTAWEATAAGNIRIFGGKIQYDLSHALQPFGGTVDGLGTHDTISDHFVYAIEVGEGKLSYATVTIEIVGSNDAPTDVTLNDSTVSENSFGASVGALATTDADVNDSHNYGVGLEDTRFEVVNGELKLVATESLDFEQEQLISVTVGSSDGEAATIKTFLIEVEDVNEAPVITTNGGEDISVRLPENLHESVVIATVVASDPDVGGGNDASSNFEDVTYAITEGNDDARFEINATTGQVSLANGMHLDFDASGGRYDLQVTAIDGGTLTDTINITVTENHAPTSLTLIGGSVQENSLNGVVVGTVVGFDPDPGDTLTYLQFGTVGLFNLDAQTGLITVARGDLLDYEGRAFAEFSVEARDSDGLRYFESFTIHVSDMPSVSSFTGSALDDVVDGTSFPNALIGGDGADRLYGGESTAPVTADTLNGGDGSDALYGQHGNDILNGDAGDDILDGGFGEDTLNGGAGNDTLIGGEMRDTLDGGPGNDLFIWRYFDETGRDELNGFEPGDVLQVGDVLLPDRQVGDVLLHSSLQVVPNSANTAILVQVDQDSEGTDFPWQTLVQVNLIPTAANLNAVNEALDLSTYTRTAYVG